MQKQFRDLGKRLKDFVTPKYGTELDATTGLKDGTINGSKKGWIWCVLDSSGQPLQVYNGNTVPTRPNIKIKIGYKKGDPRLLRALRVRNVWDTVLDSTIQYHGETHQFPNPDTVWVEQAQFVPLMVQPGGGFIVQVYGASLLWPDGSGYVTINSQTLDLSTNVPSGAARWALIQAHSDGTVTAKNGSTVATPGLLSDADIPLPDSNCLQMVAIRLYDGQESIARNSQVNDFKDLRTYAGGGGSGTGDVIQTGSVTAGHLASWDSDKHIEDSGIAAADVITDPETVVSTLVNYGPNLITNGDFDTDATGWNVGTGWAWEDDGAGGGWMRHTAGNTAELSQDGELIWGAVYAYGLEIGGTTGSVTIAADDGEQFVVNATDITGWNFLAYTPDVGLKIKITPSSDFDGYVDTISVARPSVVQEAKIDGSKTFGRLNAAWTAVTEEAPIDGSVYARQDGAWEVIVNAPASVQIKEYSDSPYTANALKDCTVIWDASGGACVQNLPAATNSGKIFYFKKVDSSANTVTVTPDGTDTIDGAANYVLTAQYESVTVQDCAVGTWYVI